MADFSQNTIIYANAVSKLSHADTDGSHGKADATHYGHVKISDATNSTATDTAASSKAVQTVQSSLDTTNSNVNNLTTKVNGITLTSLGGAPAYSYGTSDLTAGSSSLATGKLHFVYE